ncbi:MAG: hypothetical protein WCI77_04945 [Candidatus Omnitrophota bacterium]
MARVFFKKGVTLSEILVAALILVSFLSALLISFIACFLLNEANRNQMIAISHAQYIMEEIKNQASTSSGFDQLTSSYVNTTWDWLSPETINTKGLVALKDESINTNVTGTTLRNMAVTVTWHDRSDRDRSVAIETTITKP